MLDRDIEDTREEEDYEHTPEPEPDDTAYDLENDK
jgi:hypothetical protein